MNEGRENDCRRDSAVSASDKLAFLSRPAAYPDRPARVHKRETHMAWVFLTDQHAYKMKKPVRFPFLDYTTLARRQEICRTEVRLNRRLADWVYLGISRLLRRADGTLSLVDDGDQREDDETVEWLVKMVRLADDAMLDRAIDLNRVEANGARRTARHLAGFYRKADPVGLSGAAYRIKLEQAVAEYEGELAKADGADPRHRDVAARLQAFLRAHGPMLERRAETGRVIDGHGDLRPDHIYLGDPPAIIDCIEFKRAFREVDPLDELAFLWMECARLGAQDWGEVFLGVYLDHTGDEAPVPLMLFYRATRALLRAKLTLSHLSGDGQEAEAEERRRWIAKAKHYIDLADRFARRLP